VRIPLAYNLRNLAVRHTTTLLTALGIALTVAVLLSVLALVAGLRHGFEASGHPLHLLVMRKGATAELTSILSRETFQQLRLRPGIARGRDGAPRASLEMVTGLTLNNAGKTNTMNLVLRGISPVGVEMRSPIRFM
jgi:putative ABC transport system permease protein